MVMDTPVSLAYWSTPHEHPLVGVEEWLVLSGRFSLLLSCSEWLVTMCSVSFCVGHYNLG